MTRAPIPFADALRELGFDADDVLARARDLVALRVRRQAMTPGWTLVVAPEGVSVRPRADVIGELKAAGLDDPARLLAIAKPKPGELMAWISGANDCAVYKLSVPSPAKGVR